jgi:hypothetical protein
VWDGYGALIRGMGGLSCSRSSSLSRKTAFISSLSILESVIGSLSSMY